MTGEQKAWLDARKAEGYRPLGVAPGGWRWSKIGMLHADGTFEAKAPGARPSIRVGSFEVGVLVEVNSAPQMQGS